MNVCIYVYMYICIVLPVFIVWVFIPTVPRASFLVVCYNNPRKRANYLHGGHGLRAGLPLLCRTPPLLPALSPGRDCRCGRATCSGGADKSRG